MVFSFVVLALAVAGANALTINTPTGPINECENFLLTWDGATGRTQISVFPQGVTSGPALETLPVQTGNSYTWLVDQPVGSYTLAIKDLETGESVFSGAAQVTPNPGGDRTCEGKNGSTPPGTGTTPGDSTTPPGSTPPPSGGSSDSPNPSASNTGSGSSPSSTEPPNGAAALSVTSATGVLGLIAAFLLA